MTREKAIKIIKEFINGTCLHAVDQEALETLIPELKENEDERIRKGLIEALKTSKTVGELKFILPEPTREEGIAYLEKQKEANKAIEAVERIDKYIDENVANAHDMKDSNPDKKYYRGWDDALGEMARILQDVYSGKNQKEQKGLDVTNFCQPINPDIAKALPDVINELTWGNGEKQKETPEEPKIAFGDWGDKEKQEAIFTCLKYMRFIKKITNQEYNDLTEWLGSNLVYNLLGNGWYLKQKEQKPIKWTDLTWKDIVELEGIINNVHYDFSAGIGQESFGKEVLERFRNKKDDVEVDACEQKPVVTHGETYHVDTLGTQQVIAGKMPQKSVEWSEEDERMRSNILNVLTSTRVYTLGSHGTSVYKYNNEIEWLKSLSSNLKKKNEDVAKLCSNEWSKEDEKRVKQLIYDTEAIRAGYEKRKESLGDDFNDELIKDCDEQINWLKSLRPSWKPSEDDIKMLEHIIGQYEIGNKNSKVMGYLPRVEELNFLKKVLAKWKNLL